MAFFAYWKNFQKPERASELRRELVFVGQVFNLTEPKANAGVPAAMATEKALPCLF